MGVPTTHADERAHRRLIASAVNLIEQFSYGAGRRAIGALANDATPSVAGYRIFLTGGTTAITDLDDGVVGQELLILAEHSVTVTDGTNIFLSGSANFSMVSGDALRLIQKADGLWYETARFVDAGGGGGSGDVTKVGTPVNNEIGVWTGDGTLEGDDDLTIVGAALTLGKSTAGADLKLNSPVTGNPILRFLNNAVQKAYIQYQQAGGVLYIDCDADIDLRPHNTLALQVDKDATAGNTRMLVFDVDNNTLERVSVGSANSGGSGYKVLRIPN